MIGDAAIQKKKEHYMMVSEWDPNYLCSNLEKQEKK